MSWYDEMVAAGRSKSLTTGNIRCGVAAVHEVLGSPALETPVNSVVKIPRLKSKSEKQISWNGLEFVLRGCVGKGALDGDRIVALNKK